MGGESWGQRYEQALACLPQNKNNHKYFQLILKYIKEYQVNIKNHVSQKKILAGKSPKEVREEKKRADLIGGPHLLFGIKRPSTEMMKIMERVFEECAARNAPMGIALIEIACELSKKKKPTTVRTYMRDIKQIVELATDTEFSSPLMKGLMKTLKTNAAMAKKKKAAVWTKTEAREVEDRLPKIARRAFRIGLALSARAADLDQACHISAKGGMWRVEIPATKSRGMTGRTVVSIPMDWVKEMGLKEWVCLLKQGDILVSRAAYLALDSALRGKKHAMRRTSINWRLDAGHAPDSIRATTLHLDNSALFNYVGRLA